MTTAVHSRSGDPASLPFNRINARFIGHHFAADAPWMQHWLGIETYERCVLDTEFAQQTVDESSELGLERGIAMKYTNLGRYDQDLVMWKREHKELCKGGYGYIPSSILHPYGAKDVCVPYRAYPMIKRQLEAQRLWEYYRDIFNPFVTDVFVEFTMTGLPMDVPMMDDLRTLFSWATERLNKDLRKRIAKEAVQKFKSMVAMELGVMTLKREAEIGGLRRICRAENIHRGSLPPDDREGWEEIEAGVWKLEPKPIHLSTEPLQTKVRPVGPQYDGDLRKIFTENLTRDIEVEDDPGFIQKVSLPPRTLKDASESRDEEVRFDPLPLIPEAKKVVWVDERKTLKDVIERRDEESIRTTLKSILAEKGLMKEINKWNKRILHLVGSPTINIQSPDQMATWLFDFEGLTPIKSTNQKAKGLPSMSWEKVLELPADRQALYKPAVDAQTLTILSEELDTLDELLNLKAIGNLSKAFFKEPTVYTDPITGEETTDEHGLHAWLCSYEHIHDQMSMTETVETLK